ncbi:unnamed protein product [Rotaria sp. Silwood2]|nr:unnamed protein product [Rotaria sp. Silwood2]CAF3908859.1 unnamed protein product [Rotaria sp. Silwood2]CAF3912283.1 unnamed protein product [Rotaria sp. Silwood2]
MYWTTILFIGFLPIVSSVGQFGQCGGEGYVGPTECDWPLQCFRRSVWFSSCQTSCPGLDWECASSGSYLGGSVDDAGAPNWEQCGGEGWNGATWCLDYPCEPRSQWYSQCRPDCPPEWLCSEIPDEEIPEEDVEDLELYDTDDIEEEETETDEFPDPSTVDLDALQQKEQALLGEVDMEKDPFADAEDGEEFTIGRRRRRNIG